MLVDLDKYSETPIDSIQMPKAFREALRDTLQKIDCYKDDMRLSYVFLFGSVARGEALFGSDIDLLLLTNASTEREVRTKVIQYDLEDDTAYIPVQITVRKTLRFLDEDADVCDFNKIILPDLVLLRRYL